MNKILIIGKGGREHTLAWKFAQSPQVETVYVAPGNPGMTDVATPINIEETDFDALAAFAHEKGVAFTFVGPEAPLVDGIVDRFQAEGLRIFGPRANAAIIEGSKSFAKELMKKYNIPTAAYEVFTDYEPACAFLETLNAPYVLKADGLAAGKGVIIAENLTDAKAALRQMLPPGQKGKVVIEEFLDGCEFSFMAFVNGTDVFPMVLSKDHKRAYDNDKGPNTGGMGAYAPVPQIGAHIIEESLQKILLPTAAAMVAEGRPFTGILYAGLIDTAVGPKVIEFNARFGDPETEVILPLLESDLFAVITEILQGGTPTLRWKDSFMLGVVLASRGYPGEYTTGAAIEGLETLQENTLLFHCGTDRKDGGLVTNGGRVLLAAREAASLSRARDELYPELAKIRCENLFYRTDIGKMMNLLYQGKTKDVYDNGNGTYTLQLKDTATGKDGVFDPGENTVGLSIDGLGASSLRLSKYYFEKIAAAGIASHFISADIERAQMVVTPAEKFGGGLEFICRVKADGSFLRRYGDYATRGQDLNYFVEATIKDDMRGDPPISEDALVLLGFITRGQYQECKRLTVQITKLIEQDLLAKGLQLFDIKFEFGKNGKNGGNMLLIDEVSAGCMRAYKDGKSVPPMELAELILK